MQGIDDAGDGMAEKLDRGREGPGGDLKAKRPRTPQPSTASQMALNDKNGGDWGPREDPCFPWLNRRTAYDVVPVLWGFLCPRSQQTQEERTERGMMSEVHTGTCGAGRCLGASAKGPRLRSALRPQQGGLPSLQGAPRAAKPRRLATVSRSHPSKRGQALRAAASVQHRQQPRATWDLAAKVWPPSVTRVST
ncbi:uncharacterized protein AAG666_003962 isoform 1-T3 [Megaptera novaeangliae]